MKHPAKSNNNNIRLQKISRASAWRSAPLWLICSLAVFLVIPAGRAQTCRDGCDTTNTYQGDNALAYETYGGIDHTAFGFHALQFQQGGYSNTAVGALSLASTALSNENTAIGVDALTSDFNGSQNTAVGYQALFSDDAVLQNTALGYQALFSSQIAGSARVGANTAVGYQALYSDKFGMDNTAIGNLALYSYSSSLFPPGENTAVGSNALFSNTSAVQNTATGADALYYNQASYNTATGYQALYYNTTGTQNTADGYLALYRAYSAGNNTATGAYALFSTLTGSDNTADGAGALQLNNSGTQNTAAGTGALYANTTGSSNTAQGWNALLNNTVGGHNVAGGYLALSKNTSGNNNTAIGNNALLANTTGASNIAIGDSAGSLLTTGSNNIDIGNKGVAAEAAKIRIGTKGTHTNTFIAGISGVTVAGGVNVIVDTTGHLGTVTSSARYKEAIKPMNKASEDIFSLEPVSFRYKRALDPDGIPQFGLVAEQVEKVNHDLVVRDDQGKPYSVRYDAVNAMLLNEFLKEHRRASDEARINHTQEATIADLKFALAKQQEEIRGLRMGLQHVSDRLEANAMKTQLATNN